MTEAIILALITGGVTLVTSLGSSILVFIVNNKKIRAEQDQKQSEQIAAQNKKIEDLQKELTNMLNEHKKEYLNEINNIHTSINDIKNDAKSNQALINNQIQTLSDRVEKHNNVIERTYALEKDVAILKSKSGN